jgi:hypothetical protein
MLYWLQIAAHKPLRLVAVGDVILPHCNKALIQHEEESMLKSSAIFAGDKLAADINTILALTRSNNCERLMACAVSE